MIPKLILLCLVVVFIKKCFTFDMDGMENEIENQEQQQSKRSAERTQFIQGPKRLEDRIAIIGAGPSGIHMAVLLKDKGFKNIKIYEKGDRIGGKAMTVFHNKAPQELGACCMGPGYESNVIDLIKRFAPSDLVQRQLAAVWVDDLKMPIRYDKYIVRESMKHFQTRNKTIAVGKLVQQMKLYVQLHRRLFGNYEFELMPRPSKQVLAQCQGSFLHFLKKHKMDALVPIFIVSHTLQGYDYLDEIGAFYGLMWNPPSLINGLLAILGGDPTPRTFLTKNGFQSFWETVARKSNLSIHLNRKIRSVVRGDSGVLICRWGAWSCNQHDFVIWSPELKSGMKYIDRPTHEEKHIFKKMHSRYLITTLVDVIGGTRAAAPTEYFLDNISKKRDWTIWAVRDSYESINGKDPSASKDETRSLITYQARSDKPCIQETELKVEKHFYDRKAKDVHIVQHEIWKYFPRFPEQDILNGVLWDILEMQGKKKMWYIGSSVSFESLKSVIEYNKLLISKMSPVEGQ